jgi:GTP-binding protein Era
MKKRSGFLTIIGVPNAGKSTLINSILGEKVGIVSDKPQTTRRMTKGILTIDNSQFVFIDTPGFHNSNKIFNKLINEEIDEALTDCDIIIFITDSSKEVDEDEKKLLENIKKLKASKILIFNKIDLGLNNEKKDFIINFIFWDKIYYFSLIKEFNREQFLNELSIYLKDTDEFYYDEDLLTDLTDKNFFEDIITEKVYHYTYQEIPYSTYVEVIIFNEQEDFIEVHANICVERESQKSIVIGKNGEMIKKIRVAAQKELRKIYGKKIELNLFVKVDKNWSKRIEKLKNLGFIVNKKNKSK